MCSALLDGERCLKITFRGLGVTFIGWDGTRADAEQIVDLEAATKADDAEEDRDDYRGAWKDYNPRG